MLFENYFIYLAIVIAIPIFAQLYLRSKTNKYLDVKNHRGITGAKAAEQILENNHIYDVKIEAVRGFLTDHYDPRTKTVRLSEKVFFGNSIVSMSVAAHEVGHALQHHYGYAPLKLRNTLLPITIISNKLSFIVILIGFIFQSVGLIDIGIGLLLVILTFQILTLPIEFNASNRAFGQLEAANLIYYEEGKGVKSVLNAAALTYVASVAVAVLEILRLLFIRNLMDD